MSYQIINTGTDNGAVSSPQIVKSINQPAPAKEGDATKKISKNQIQNHLNYINFQDESIAINFKHLRFDHSVSLQAKPQPCTGSELSCLWADSSEIGRKLNTYGFENISFRYGNNNLILRPELLNIDKSGISLALSELYYPLIFKKITHHPCKGIKAQLIQNSAVFKGNLTDFSSTSFHVRVALVPPQTSQWINPGASVEVILSNETEILYSGECWISENCAESDRIVIGLKPLSQNINRFKQKKFRSLRESIIPAPNILIKHPITGKLIELKVVDLSGSGFSVEADRISTMLLPGMIFPQVIMSFSKQFRITFKAQAIYVKNIKSQNNERIVKVGIAIIDIDPESHNNLMGILHQTQDEHSYINNEIDLNELWDFFFESGFIYPEKYSFLQDNREAVKNTFKRIYGQGADIARHFVFQKQGRINSHMSTIRFYEKSWLIHHHAARKSSLNSGGLSVLNQIGRFINDSHRLYSAKMDFVFCYFRVDNKFPSRVFGGASRIIKNPKACSLDSFAYLHFNNNSQKTMIPLDWELGRTNQEDLFELEAFYKIQSNGLMLNALDLTPTQNNLKEISDIGLNLSDLTNSTTVYILDSNDLPYNILIQAISIIVTRLSMEDSPVLLYPLEYLKIHEIPYERIYRLWVLNMNSTDHYFRYLKRLLRFVKY